MFRSIVVPLDGSRFGEQVLPTAIHLAKTDGAALHLVHVHVARPPETHLEAITPYAYQRAPDSTIQHDEEARREEAEYLDGLVREVSRKVPVLTSELRMGERLKHAIEDSIRRWNADLVVMARHARTLERVHFESLGEAIVRELGLPIFLIPVSKEEESSAVMPLPGHVLITLDGSPFAEQVIEPAVSLARDLNAKITLLAVEENGRRRVSVDPRIDPIADGPLGIYLRGVRDHLSALGVNAACHVVQNSDVAAAIIGFVHTHAVDTIAMATHGRAGLSRLLLGSVVEKVVHTTNLPVLLVRPGVTLKSAATQSVAAVEAVAPLTQ